MSNNAARFAGVLAGQKRSTALALCPQIRIVERDLKLETAALNALAIALLRYTPHITLVRSTDHVDGILLELHASLRLFGGLQALLHAVRFTVTELGLSAQMANFSTATGAWLVARKSSPIQTTPHAEINPAAIDALDVLDRVPVALMDATQAHSEKLLGIGINVLGQLRYLPREGVARRFGQAVLDELDRAYGDMPDPRIWFSAPAEFRTSIELHARVETTEALFFAVRRLLIQLVGWLRANQSSLRAFTLFFDHEPARHAPVQASIVVNLARASCDLDHLCLLVREHLARTTLSAPVLLVGLHAVQIETMDAPNENLFPGPETEVENTERLLERLSARLGHQSVHRLSLIEDHRPEAAQRWEQAFAQHARPHVSHPKKRDATQTAEVSNRSPRPTWLLSSPLRLAVRDHKPFHHCRLHLVAGPERIETGWWDATAVRDYFVAENDDAELLWVFRERLTGGDENWYLHGKFA
jgi:protein ImuB